MWGFRGKNLPREGRVFLPFSPARSTRARQGINNLPAGHKGDVNQRYPLLLMGALLVASQAGAVVAAGPLSAAGVQAVEDPSSPLNSLMYMGIILGFTLFLLVTARLGLDILIRAIFALALVSAIYYAGLGLLLPLLGETAFVAAAVAAVGFTAAAILYPEWWVIDTAGLFIAIGVTAILGVSLEIFPVILLLLGLAVYDAIAVYRTKHMLDLADSALDMKLPVVFVVPVKKGYSFLEASGSMEEGERDAFFMGLGDAIIPGVLTVSSYVFGAPVQAAGAFVGSFLGFVLLSYLVASGKPQAGLPSLNGGAILGFLVASLATGAPVL